MFLNAAALRRPISVIVLSWVFATSCSLTTNAAEPKPADSTANPTPASDTDPVPISLTLSPAIVLVSGGANPTVAPTASGTTLRVGERSVVLEMRSDTGLMISSTKIAPDDKGSFNQVLPAPTKAGKYKVVATAPDGRGHADAAFTAIDGAGIGPTTESVMSEALNAVIDATTAVEAQVDAQIESPPKAAAKKKLSEVHQLLSLAQATENSALQGTIGTISANVGIVFSEPGQYDKYAPRLKQVAAGIDSVASQSSQLETLTSKMSAADAGCHQLAFVTEVLKTLSALLNLKTQVLGTVVGFAKDVDADLVSNVTKNASHSSAVAFLSGQLAKNLPELNDASKLVGNAYTIMANLGAYISGELFDKYCEQISGPIEGIMNARFYWVVKNGEEPREWWSYNYKISGRLVLYFPKSAKGNATVNLNGRIEGYAHDFQTREDALPVMFPRLMAGAQQIKRRIPPIEMGGAARGAAQGAAPLSAYIEGSGPGLALPNSFLINVTGTMDTSSITVKLGNALTDIHAAHVVTVIIFSPLMAGLGPQFTWYRLKFQKVRNFIENSVDGETFSLPLKTQSETITAKQAFTGKAGKSKAKADYTFTVQACDPGC